MYIDRYSCTYFIYLFLVGLGFELTCQAGVLQPELHLQPIFALVILDMGFLKLFAQAGIEPQPSQSQLPKKLGFICMGHWCPVT
jgi:hypothetical protein